MGKSTIYLSRFLMLVYAVAICVLCFAHVSPIFDLNGIWLGIPKDKILHFIMFLPLPILAYMSFHRSTGKPSRLIIFLLITLIAGTVAGGAIELLQQFTGYRSCDILDFRADCLGLFTSTVLVLCYGAISKKW